MILTYGAVRGARFVNTLRRGAESLLSLRGGKNGGPWLGGWRKRRRCARPGRRSPKHRHFLPPSLPSFLRYRFTFPANRAGKEKEGRGGEERNLAREITWLLANLASSGGEERVS